MPKRNISSHQKCCFCGLTEDNEVKYGKTYTSQDITTHYYCLLLSSNMEQRGRDNEGILGFLREDIRKEVSRGKRLICSYCKKRGATLGCCNTKCKKIFHYPCGAQRGSLHQFFGEFKSFCSNHRLRQKVDDTVKQEIKALNEVLCCICYDQVDPEDSTYTLWASCCKKAWFHKECVQQLAISAGYFFKCPLCNSKKEFQEEMLQNGIFIPHQDASWELVPHAFQELLYRHDSCDAVECLCPKGRTHRSNNAKWELVLCRTCGSQGIHMACGELKWGSRSLWDCKECRAILTKTKETTSSGTVVHIRRNGSNTFSDDDSDSDVSVGVEFPIFNTSTETPRARPRVSTSPVALLPGPKCYKIQQLLSQDFGKPITARQTEKCGRSSAVDGSQPQTSKSRSQLSNSAFTPNKSSSHLRVNIKQSPSSSRSNVITIDSDDDIVEITEQSKQTDSRSSQASNSSVFTYASQAKDDPSLKKSFILSNVHNEETDDEIIECGSPMPASTIKITNVTSLPHERFASEPETSSDSADAAIGYSNSAPNLLSSNAINFEAILKRKSNLLLTSPLGNGMKRVRSEEFTRVTTPDQFDSPCSGSQSLPPTFMPGSRSPTLSQPDFASGSSNTLRDTDLEDNDILYPEQDSRSGSTTETSYVPDNVQHSVNSFRNLLPSSSINSAYTAVQNNLSVNPLEETICEMRPLVMDKMEDVSNSEDHSLSDNPLEETICEMHPLIMDEDENVSNSEGLFTTSSKNRTNFDETPRKTNDMYIESVSNQAAVSSVNPDEHMESSSTATRTTENTFRMNTDHISNCHDGADTSIIPEPSYADWDSGTSCIIRASERSDKLCSSSCPDKWSHSSAASSTRAWSAGGNEEDTFSTITTNYTACDRLRLIPETIRLQDLKFHICSANVLKMVLYDTFSVNISTEQKTECELYSQTATRAKQSQTENEPIMPVDNKQSNLCTDGARIEDDTKENFNPVTVTNFKRSANNSPGTNCLSAKDINLCNLSPLRDRDVAAEEKCGKNRQYRRTCTSPLPDLKSSDDDDRPDVGERVSPTSFYATSIAKSPERKRSRKSCSEKRRAYTRTLDYESSAANQDTQNSKEKKAPQHMRLRSLKVSIDLNKISNVININTLHPTLKRTSLSNGDSKQSSIPREKKLRSNSYSSHSSHMSEESLTSVTNTGHSLRRRSNRHFEKACPLDRYHHS